MNTELFDWNAANIGHIAEHDITPDEAEEALLGDPLEMDCETGDNGEDRWTYVGETSRSKILQVVITLRSEKIRVVTAFEATRRDKLLYLATKARQQ